MQTITDIAEHAELNLDDVNAALADLGGREGICKLLGDDAEISDLIMEADGSTDFEFEGYRFISDGAIDKIMQDELSNDLYVLGCFNASFLAGILDIDYDVIESMQSAEAYEAIGKLIISMKMLEELQSEYASADGYGHHFALYDGHGHELGNWHAFRID